MARSLFKFTILVHASSHVTVIADRRNQGLFSSTESLLTLGLLSCFLAHVKINWILVPKPIFNWFSEMLKPEWSEEILSFNYINFKTISAFSFLKSILRISQQTPLLLPCSHCLHFIPKPVPTGGGQGNPLQYACLENPLDRGAWWATVHRILKSWTQLKQLSRQAYLLI